MPLAACLSQKTKAIGDPKPLYEIKKDGFYGHPASLVWRRNHEGREPRKIPVADQVVKAP